METRQEDEAKSKVVYFFGRSGNYREVHKISALTVKAGDYITIGDDIVIQVLKVGDLCRVAVDAPREMAIGREQVHEITSGIPEMHPEGAEKVTVKEKRF